MPALPIGARATGMAASRPAMRVFKDRSVMSTRIFCRSLIASKALRLPLSVLSVHEPASV